MAITNKDIDDIMQNAQQKLDELFIAVKMPESHGVAHCLVVLGNMNKAIANVSISYSDCFLSDIFIHLLQLVIMVIHFYQPRAN